MGKTVKLSIVLIMAVCAIIMIGSNVYAALSCNVDMNIARTQYDKNEIFTIDVNISNITTDRGVIAFGATLEYDKDSLTLEKMEGQNGWETPMAGGSYNEDTGIMAITRGAVGNNDETILRLTFKVKENAKTSAKVTLKDVSVSDGTLARIATISKEITIKEGTSNPDPIIPNEPETPEVPNKPTSPDDNTENTNKEDIKDGKLPQAGENDIIMIAVIGIGILGAITLYVRAKKFSDIK